ncbi:MAG: Gfo/Idh/MocA family oxidoreductase [Thermomicrobiales bacterium]|nr:Gfo/Idh/MocA family oxidoreductase [Thermomicrobiales bacterium]
MTTIGIGLVGYKFMGKAHSNAYRQVNAFFPDTPKAHMIAIAGRNEDAVAEAAETFGWESWTTDYHDLLANPEIDVIDVSTPGHLHHTVVMEAFAAGKNVFCEKPLANTLAEAAEMVQAWKAAGTVGMINFNYRKVPAVILARQIIESGRIGEIRSFRGSYLQDWLRDPNATMGWRLQKEFAGSGALGDIGAHITDLAHMLVGPITSVTGMLRTAIPQRPLESDPTQMGDVTVDDWTGFLATFANGATGVFEASRLATGRRNHNAFEINGSKGSIAFNLERMNELEVYFDDDAPDVRGFRTILVTEGVHPYVNRWWPSGHIIGWEHTHVHQVHDLLVGVAEGVSPAPSFADGFRCQAVLDAVERSAASGRWETPVALPE